MSKQNKTDSRSRDGSATSHDRNSTAPSRGGGGQNNNSANNHEQQQQQQRTEEVMFHIGETSLSDPGLSDDQRQVMVEYLKHVLLKFIACEQSEVRDGSGELC